MEEFYSGLTFSKIQQNIFSALFSTETFRELHLADCFKTNLSNLLSFELARVLRPKSSNTLERKRKRKSGEEGRRGRKKGNGCTCLVFIIALLERFWPKNTVCRNVFKN